MSLKLGTTDIGVIIKGGSGGKPEQTKTATPSTSQQTITPDTGYTLSSVTVNAVTSSIDNNIQASNIKSGVTILGVEGTVHEGITPTGTVSITTNGTHDVTNYASASVNVESTINNQNKTVTPTTSQQSITADSGYTGLGTVTVSAVDNTIDANITAGNIKKNVSILGVTGTYEGATLYFMSDGRAYQANMVLPSTVTSLISPYYKGMTNLQTLDMSSASCSIYSGMCQDCSNLTSVSLPPNYTGVLPQDCFNGCSSLPNVTLPAGITTIGTRVFRNCRALQTMSIPEGCTGITTYVFQNCSSLTTLTLPSTFLSIGGSSFSGCSSLKNVTLPQGYLGTGTNFSASTQFTATDIMNMFNALGTVPEGETRSFVLGATNLAKLTADQKAVATDKGWTIS